MSEHSLRRTCKFLETGGEFRNLENVLMRKGLWVWAAEYGQVSFQAQVCRLTLVSSWCEALKVILVCFERQLGSQWYWLSLQVKEMALRKVGGLALWDFLDFIVRTRIPIFVLLRPFIQCKVCSLLLLLGVMSPMNMLLLPGLRQDYGSSAYGMYCG